MIFARWPETEARLIFRVLASFPARLPGWSVSQDVTAQQAWPAQTWRPRYRRRAGSRGSSNNGTASGDSGLRVARPAHGTRLTRWPAWAAQAEVLLRQALEIFERIGAAEAPDILAELGALTAPDPHGKPKHHAGRAR